MYILYKEQIKHLRSIGKWPSCFDSIAAGGASVDTTTALDADAEAAAAAAAAAAATQPADLDMPPLESLSLGPEEDGGGYGGGDYFGSSASESDDGLPELIGNPNRRKFDRELTSESESETESED